MVDIVIDPSASGINRRITYSRYVVGVDQDNHYIFFVHPGVGLQDLFFKKSIDGGATWSARTTIHVGNVVKMSIWYDPWNTGDTGTLIYIVLLDADVDSLSYYTLDTSDDTLSAETEIDTPVVDSANAYSNNQVAIAKARGGNLLVQYWGDAIGSHGCWRSVDGGASWVERADGAASDGPRWIMMFPGNEANDQDMWMLHLDGSLNILQLKTYDDSADSWSTVTIAIGINEAGSDWHYGAAIRHSDNHLLGASWTIRDSATGDIITFDVNGAGSIVLKTDVVTDLPESGNICFTINQQNGDVYVGYNKGGVYFATVDSVYKKSVDGMSTWQAEEAMSENAADDYRSLSSTLSIGDVGGKFLPAWSNDDLSDLLCNVNNAVSIDPFVPPPPDEPGLPEYGQRRAAIGDPSVYGATIVRS